jgi:magnesium transporter
MYLQTIQELLDKLKILEGTGSKQGSPRQNQAESLTYWKHMGELRALLVRVEPAALARILEALPRDDALLVWDHLDDKLTDDVLEELSDSLRETLAAQHRTLSMNAFELAQGRLHQIAVTSPEDLVGAKPIWVDLVGPTETDRQWLGFYFDIEVPDPNDLTDLEASARFYVEENGEIHLHSDFLLDREGDSRNVAVAFILYRDILFSVRQEELPVFRLQRLRARTQAGYVTDGKDMLLDLYAADAEYSADALEDVYAALGAVGKQVLSKTMTDEEAAKILAAIAEEEDLNGRIRRNVLDTRRALTFLIRRRLLSPAQFDDAQQIMRDIESLDGHTAFLFDKINFLMDATVGFININQNKIIKIFSVASVALLPPTLIASIYGMNFKNLPELDWFWGYPFSLVLMVTSVAIPIIFFRRKGWLR